jgi:hypothetical protein
MDARAEDGARAHPHAGFDDAKRTNNNILTEFGFRVNKRSRVNADGGHRGCEYRKLRRRDSIFKIAAEISQIGGTRPPDCGRLVAREPPTCPAACRQTGQHRQRARLRRWKLQNQQGKVLIAATDGEP